MKSPANQIILLARINFDPATTITLLPFRALVQRGGGETHLATELIAHPRSALGDAVYLRLCSAWILSAPLGC